MSESLQEALEQGVQYALVTERDPLGNPTKVEYLHPEDVILVWPDGEPAHYLIAPRQRVNPPEWCDECAETGTHHARCSRRNKRIAK